MFRYFTALLVITALLASSLIVVKPTLASNTSMVENSWTEKNPMPTARSSFGVAVVAEKIYAIGGTDGINEEYNPATDTWTTKTSMPRGRANLAVVSFEGKIYCIGGDLGGDVIGGNPTNVTEVYDPVTDSWTTKAPMPTARFSLQANVVGDKIYLIGGFPYPDKSCLNEVYDPATDSWTTATPIPRTVAGYVSTVVNDKIYVIDSGATEIYDTAKGTWSQGVAPPLQSEDTSHTPWGAGATACVNAPVSIDVFTENAVEVYFPQNDSWVLGASLPKTRSEFGVAVVNDLFYVIGGYSQAYVDYPDDWMHGPKQTYYATNEQYTPFGYSTVLSPSVSPSSVPSTSSLETFPTMPIMAVSVIAIAAITCIAVLTLIKNHRRKMGT